MSDVNVIGIGGTGTKCVYSLVMLLAAGLYREPVDISFLDQDISNGNLSETRRLISLYQKLRPVLRRPIRDPERDQQSPIFAAPIYGEDRRPDRQPKAYQPVDPPFEKLGHLFQRSLLKEPARHLFDSLFDPQKEIEMELVHGFRGRPAIGQAVLAAGLQNKKIPFWEDLDAKVNCGFSSAARFQKYFLFGSVFGGTGAAGVPTVARHLQKRFSESTMDKEGLIGAALLLPYFSYPDDDEFGDVVRGQLTPSATLMARSRMALDYYRMQMEERRDKDGGQSEYDALYLVGWPETISMEYQSAGGGTQNNPSLLPELIAGLSALHFANGSNQFNGKVFRAGYIGNQVDWQDLPTPLDRIESERMLRPLATMIRFAFIYKYIYYECIFGDQKNIYRNQVWYTNIIGAGFSAEGTNADIGRTLFEFCDHLLRWTASLALHGTAPRCGLFRVATTAPPFAQAVVEHDESGRQVGKKISLFEDQDGFFGRLRGGDRGRYLPFEQIKDRVDAVFDNLVNWGSPLCTLKEIYSFLCTARPDPRQNPEDLGFPAFVHYLWIACGRTRGERL